MLKRPFILPSAPVLKHQPPTGPEWSHDVKHDGWRAQLHRSRANTVIFSKNGKDISGRFQVIRDAFRNLPPCIIDAEIVGCDADGVPTSAGSWRAIATASAGGASIY